MTPLANMSSWPGLKYYFEPCSRVVKILDAA